MVFAGRGFDMFIGDDARHFIALVHVDLFADDLYFAFFEPVPFVVENTDGDMAVFSSLTLHLACRVAPDHYL